MIKKKKIITKGLLVFYESCCRLNDSTNVTNEIIDVSNEFI